MYINTFLKRSLYLNVYLLPLMDSGYGLFWALSLLNRKFFCLIYDLTEKKTKPRQGLSLYPPLRSLCSVEIHYARSRARGTSVAIASPPVSTLTLDIVYRLIITADQQGRSLTCN